MLAGFLSRYANEPARLCIYRQKFSFIRKVITEEKEARQKQWSAMSLLEDFALRSFE